MKVQEIRVAKGGLSDNIYAGKLSKDGTKWLEKKDVTNDFLGAVVARWAGKTQTITSSKGEKYVLTLAIVDTEEKDQG